MKRICVTGGLGFIGRQVVHQLLERGDDVLVVDVETYAADTRLLGIWRPFLDTEQLRYVKADIVSLTHLPDVDAVVNLAAETHVDNSIRDSRTFVQTNVLGVQNLLELCRGKELPPRFLQVSTDEVYGDIGVGLADESAPLRPSSPYAASKAAADGLVQSYGRTYRLPFAIVRPSNCYGPYQYPEKLIPKAIWNTRGGRPMPIHAEGTPVRSWLAVEDCARAILTVLDRGADAGVYNVEGNTQASVRAVVNAIATILEQPLRGVPRSRPGLDRRYQMSGEPLKALGWVPIGNLWADLPGLVEQECAHRRW